MTRLPVTEPAATHHIGQAAKAARAVTAARQEVTLVLFRQAHGDPATWPAAVFEQWLTECDGVREERGQR